MSNILRLPEVTKITGISRSTIYAMMERDDFPKPISLGARAVGWLEDEIRNWVESRASKRHENNGKR